MKDYYGILGVSQNSTDEEIRKRYRRLAMRFHPDRNPNDAQAEERFKDIAEAYGVLTDNKKRQEYDRYRTQMGSGANPSGERFSYSQEDIFRDLFRDPRFQKMFSSLLQEFQRSGFRHSTHFVRKSFFGGKGSLFLGGIFFFGSLAGPLLANTAKKALPHKDSVLKSLAGSIGQLFGKATKTISHEKHQTPPLHDKNYDTTYHTPLSAAELNNGKSIRILVFGDNGEQTLQVRIPPGSRNGQRLRLRGKGRPSPFGYGDLYLHLVEKEV
jgi:curved DNA-binding protein